MKKILFVLVFVFGISFMLSCAKGSYSAFMAYERNTNKSMAMSYERFNGYKQIEFTVNEGEVATVYVSFITKSGELDAYIERVGADAPVYIGNDVVNSSFTVDITEAGKYKIRVDGVDHSGEYNFLWEIKQISKGELE